MVKNKLEKLFSASLKEDNRFWGMKLHNNPLAHQNTPADYILTLESKRFDGSFTTIPILKRHVYLVECKQVTCKEGTGRLTFKRLKQMHDMNAFEAKFPFFHKAYWCIAFYDGRWDKSEIYLIPTRELHNQVILHNKLSFNREDMKKLFSQHKTTVVRGVIDIWTELTKR